MGGWLGLSLKGLKKGGECFYGMGYTSPRKADMIDTRLVSLLIVNPITSRLLKARKAARDRTRP